MDKKEKEKEQQKQVDEVKEHIKKKGISQNMYLWTRYRQAFLPR